MKIWFVALLGLAMFACAPAANPFDTHPAKLGQRWSFEAKDNRSHIQISALIDLNGERSIQGDSYVVSGEAVSGPASGNLAGVIYSPKLNLLAAFVVVKSAQRVTDMQIAYCYAQNPVVNPAGDYIGNALIDRLQTILDGNASASPSNPCRFTLQKANASVLQRQTASLEVSPALVKGLERARF